jgi:Na+-translocating ferredoxin:NAD+ oxidoreductase subunit G
MDNLIRFPLILVIICTVAAGGVGITYVTTRAKIRQRQTEREQSALQVVFGAEVTNRALNAEASRDERVYQVMGKDGVMMGYAAIGDGRGYSSLLRVLVGVNPDVNRVSGIMVLSQQETPGLGTRIVETKSRKTWASVIKREAIEEDPIPWFQKQFEGLPRENVNLQTSNTRGVDAITGATVTSHAVVDAVKNAIRKIEAVREEPHRSDDSVRGK